MRRPPVFFALIGYFGFCALALGALAFYWSNYQEAPVQPINFPHTIHAGKLGIDCTYCHAYADKAALPGIPPVALCMECHETAAKDRAEIIKLTGYWNRKQPIRWIRAHQLPWHVHFTHKRHIKAGLPCTTCHGEVKTEARIRRVRELVMGWCVDCHRSRQVSIDCWVCHR